MAPGQGSQWGGSQPILVFGRRKGVDCLWREMPAARKPLGPEVARELRQAGFVVIPDVVGGDELRQLAHVYDAAVAGAAPPELRVGSETTRVHGLVRHHECARLSRHPQVLGACRHLIGQPFRLSSLMARTVRPRSREQALHVDAKADSEGWPVVGFILMVDAFSMDNGATRFVPGSHEWPEAPAEERSSHVLARGPAGSLVIYNGSVWHGHSANQTDIPRRSVQGAYTRISPTT
jgi:ectoine hydroxylase-related dioxygenase (phytanoyl-CoA dioxygenase family)